MAGALRWSSTQREALRTTSTPREALAKSGTLLEASEDNQPAAGGLGEERRVAGDPEDNQPAAGGLGEERRIAGSPEDKQHAVGGSSARIGPCKGSWGSKRWVRHNDWSLQVLLGPKEGVNRNSPCAASCPNI